MNDGECHCVAQRIHITPKAVIEQFLRYVENACLGINPYPNLRNTPPLVNIVTVLQRFVKGCGVPPFLVPPAMRDFPLSPLVA